MALRMASKLVQLGIYIFPSVEFSIYVLTFYNLKSVRRKALVKSKCLLFESHLK